MNNLTHQISTWIRPLALGSLVACSFLTQVACSSLQKPFLYRAEKPDRRIDLFGTIHAGVPGWDIPASVTSSLNNANRVYFETNLLTEQKPQISLLFIEDGQLPLDLRLKPKEFAELAKALPKIPAEQLKQLRPFFVQALINENEKVRVSRYEARIMDYKNGLDMTLLKEAAKNKTPIETLDSENGIPCLNEVDDIAIGELRKMLAGEKLQSDLEAMKQLSEFYREGNESAIASLLDAEKTECVLKERNSRWAALLEKNVKAGDHVFVGVGIGHLIHTQAGPSLVELLQKQGYQVRRLTDVAADAANSKAK